MQIKTSRFGTIHAPEERILEFPEGLVGFPGLSRFLVIDDETSAPFQWLQSLDEFTSALDRIAVQQSKVGEVSRQFDRINEQQDEIILSFAEVLTKEEDTDLTQAITEFSILQTSLEAAFAATARILQVSLLEFLA